MQVNFNTEKAKPQLAGKEPPERKEGQARGAVCDPLMLSKPKQHYQALPQPTTAPAHYAMH